MPARFLEINERKWHDPRPTGSPHGTRHRPDFIQVRECHVRECQLRGGTGIRTPDPLHAMRSFSVRRRSLTTVGGLNIGLSIYRRPGATARDRRRC
jgi:hypothetical protein